MCLDISYGIGQHLLYELIGISASAPRGNRTPDLFVRSEALYPLSYEGKVRNGILQPLRRRYHPAKSLRVKLWYAKSYRPFDRSKRSGDRDRTCVGDKPIFD